MKRVFLKCTGSMIRMWLVGKEYEVVDGHVTTEYGGKILSDSIAKHVRDTPSHGNQFELIEREVFTANDQEWFKHVPGDPMPCDRDALVHCYVKENGGLEVSSPGTGKTWWWTDEGDETDIIGWRFAEEAKPESTTITLKSAFAEKSPGVYEFHVPADTFRSEGVVSISLAPEAFDWSVPPPPPLEISIADVMAHRQMVAMDTAQPESAGEKAYRLKQQAKQEAEAQKEQAKAEQMQQAGEVLSREYDNKHDHKLGMIG